MVAVETDTDLTELLRGLPGDVCPSPRAFLIRSERSRTAVRDAELAGRIDYRVLDATAGLPEQYDVITTFDVAGRPAR